MVSCPRVSVSNEWVRGGLYTRAWAFPHQVFLGAHAGFGEFTRESVISPSGDKHVGARPPLSPEASLDRPMVWAASHVCPLFPGPLAGSVGSPQQERSRALCAPRLSLTRPHLRQATELLARGPLLTGGRA